jgi:Flp pilus assembly pilin Flp
VQLDRPGGIVHHTCRPTAKPLSRRNIRVDGRAERGASAVEYGLLATLIAGVIIIAVMMLGGVVKGQFSDTNDTICTNNVNKGAAQETACGDEG